MPTGRCNSPWGFPLLMVALCRVSAFHSQVEYLTHHIPGQQTVLMAHYYDPYYHTYRSRYHRDPPHYPTSTSLHAKVVTAEIADELDDDEEEWLTDRQRAHQRKIKRGEVIDFDPEQPDFRPLKSAAASVSDMYEDENKFQGRRPGQAVNLGEEREQFSKFNDRVIVNESNRSVMNDRPRSPMDSREHHVIIDDYDSYMSDFFQPPPPIGGRPLNQPRRPSSVYTPEEEDLISSMGGRSISKKNQSTQEFAGLGTMKRRQPQFNNSVGDPQRLNYNPEQRYDRAEQQFNTSVMQQPPPPPPPPPIPGMPDQQYREAGFLGDSTLREINLDYSVPIPYLADVIANWGVPVPIDPLARLGDMVTGEQAFAILEAIHTLDIAELHERYSEDNLISICDYYDIDIKAAFDFCVERGWALPFGVQTFLRVEQEDEMLEVLGEIY